MEIYPHLENILGITFTQTTREMINNYAHLRKFNAGTTLLTAGETAQHVYLILHGIVRGYYPDSDGNDITKCFSTEQEFFCTECYRTGAPSTFSIECLENTECIELPYALIRKAVQSDKSLGAVIGHLSEQEVNSLEYRNKTILMLNAADRYIDFCSQYPDLLKRVPLKYIASYLAVRPETLSRIRKSLKISE